MPTSQDLQYYLKVASRIYLRTSTNTNFQFVFLCQHLNFGIQIPWKAIEMITFQCYKEALSTFIMTAHQGAIMGRKNSNFGRKQIEKLCRYQF